MSSNQIGGYMNRLEASRKYLFGSIGVLGTTGSSIISGALILRGQEVKPVVEVAPDWESYAYVKLDLKKIRSSLRLRWLGVWRLMKRNGLMAKT